MNGVLISIIISVYNVEKYLTKCMKSILGIRSVAFEVILVNDGSTDGSGKICDRFMKKKENIVVIHKENGGPSSARNAGIRRAAGKYLLFVDADDWINPRAAEQMLRLAMHRDSPELVFLSACKIFPNGRKERLDQRFERSRIKKKGRTDVLKYLSGLKKYPGSACTKLVKKKVIIEHSLFFADGKIEEDLEWCLKVLFYVDSFDYLDMEYYYYRQDRVGSITNSPLLQIKKLDCLIEFIIDGTFMASEEKKELAVCIYAFLAYEYVIALLFYGQICAHTHLRCSAEKSYMRFFDRFSFLMDYKRDFRTRLVRQCLSICGVKRTARWMEYYSRLIRKKYR